MLTYPEAIRRLYSLELWGIKLGLDNITRFCRRLNNPHRRFLSVHIAGTNGKGSVTALLDSILRAAGYHVGRYTSPHLRDFRERVHIEGHPIARQEVIRFLDQHWQTIHRERYTFFEAVTALAFDSFASHGLDMAVVEVGLGGHFDATNILNPALSIITHIDLDHVDVLGRTRSRIAGEKAGIIKEGTPVLIGSLPTSARRTVEKAARNLRAPLWTAHEVLAAHDNPWARELREMRIDLPLLGDHQVANLSLALAAAVLLHSGIVPLTPGALRRGVNTTCWPGRFQILDLTPRVVFDVAHNVSGVQQVVRTWQKIFGRRKAIGVFTTRTDKDYPAMWRLLAPLLSHWNGCPLPHSSGIERAEMERLARQETVPFVWYPDAAMALRRAKEMAGPNGIILVVGSHYLVGELLPPGPVTAHWKGGMTSQRLNWAAILRRS